MASNDNNTNKNNNNNFDDNNNNYYYSHCERANRENQETIRTTTTIKAILGVKTSATDKTKRQRQTKQLLRPPTDLDYHNNNNYNYYYCNSTSNYYYYYYCCYYYYYYYYCCSSSKSRLRNIDSLALKARPTNKFKLISKLHRFVNTALRATILSFLIVLLSSWITLPTVALAAASEQNRLVVQNIIREPHHIDGAGGASAGGGLTVLGEDLSLSEILVPTNNFSVSANSQLLTAVNISSVNGTSSNYNYSGVNSAYSNGIKTISTPTDIATIVYDGLSDTPTNISILLSEMEAKDDFTMPPIHTIIVSIVLLFVILGTIVGNILVCIAVCMVRKLRRPCNYLLVSLALSDLCVAVLVMPMALLYEVLEKWNFGPLLCDIWVSFDVLCCTASILNLCAISVDRYLAITKPLEYGVKRTPRRMMLCVAMVWLAAACISLPPLLILGNEHQDENGEPICTVCQNFAYQIYATLGSFYIPLAVMLFVYYQIFRAARRIVLEEKRAQTHLQHALNGTGSPPGPGNTDLSVGVGHGGAGGNGQHRHSSYGNTSLNYSTCGGLSVGHGSGGGVSGSSGLLGSPHQKKLRFQLAKEKKASTTLGIIMSAFTICWLPFFILALIRPFVESETVHVPQLLSSLFLWLGYANSLLNPIIYATLNRDFRKPFQEILYFRCSSLNTMMRENYYQDQYGEPPSQRVMLGDERHGARESFL